MPDLTQPPGYQPPGYQPPGYQPGDGGSDAEHIESMTITMKAATILIRMDSPAIVARTS